MVARIGRKQKRCLKLTKKEEAIYVYLDKRLIKMIRRTSIAKIATQISYISRQEID